MGQLQFTISLVLIGLFTIAVIGFAINFADDNSSVIDISDDSQITELYSNVEGNISGFRENSEDTYQSIVESSIEEGETTPSGGQFAITPSSATSVSKNIIKVGWIKIFGSDSGFGIFLTSLITLIIFILGMYIWKTWAGRSPD